MKKLLWLLCLSYILMLSCNKPSESGNDLRHILLSHKWHYYSFNDNGTYVPMTHCDSSSYLIFREGGNAAGANDDTVCNPTGGIFSAFRYKYVPDSGFIYVYNFSGYDFKWLIIRLDNTTLEVQFVLPLPPPTPVKVLDYVYKAG